MIYNADEWKPGDVAMVTTIDGLEKVAMRGVGTWSFAMPDGFTTDYEPHRTARAARRLVVIDPEDAEQVQRLRELVWHDSGSTRKALAAALREYANPVPRIEEPLSVGSLIEDTDKRIWVRTGWATWHCLTEDHDAALWDDLRVAEVLR
jgi:hypothetical protein